MRILSGSLVAVTVMSASGPAAQVEGTVIEQLTVTWREEKRGENDKGIRPNKKSVLYAPPFIIVDMTLCVCCVGEGGCN